MHHVATCTPDEGAEDGIMWHRGITHEQERQIEAGSLLDADDDGTRCWDYFVLYRPLDPAGYEVVGVRSNSQIASWDLMYGIFRVRCGPGSMTARPGPRQLASHDAYDDARGQLAPPEFSQGRPNRAPAPYGFRPF